MSTQMYVKEINFSEVLEEDGTEVDEEEYFQVVLIISNLPRHSYHQISIGITSIIIM